MSNSHAFIKFGEIADFRNGLNFDKESHGKGCLLIGVADFQKHFTPSYESLEEINPDGVSREEDYIKKNDLIFVRSNGNKSLVGRSLFIDRDIRALYSGFCIRARLKNDVINPLFLAYYTKTNHFKASISYAAGTNINNLSQGILSEVNVPHYSKESQLAITNVLSAIDQKIELNNRINAELEAMAKTLYDYWFVQFDFPFDFAQGKPAANGKPYKSSGGKMVYNPILKREIPVGWETTPLSSITSVSNDSLNPADTPEKAFKHFSIPVFDATNTYGVELGETIGSNKFTVEKTDLLVSKLNPWFNRVVYAMDEEDQICSTEFVVWRSPNTQIKNFLYLIATSPQFIAHCTQSATGTSNSHKRVNPNVMMRFLQPFDSEVGELFGQIVEPVLKKLIVNQRENTKLASLRDWLLPMLMNGQVTVQLESAT